MSYDFSTLDDQLGKTIEWLEREYSQISAGRANPSLLDGVRISSYGSEQPIKNVASLTLEDARTIRVVPWDKSQIKDIERAVQMSNLPLAVSIDDAGLRLNVPEMTEENRKSIVKIVREKLEDARITVRSERQAADKEIDKLCKDSMISEDERDAYKKKLQQKVDDTNKALERIATEKEASVMKI